MQNTFQDSLFDGRPEETSVGFVDPLFETSSSAEELSLPARQNRVGRGIDLLQSTLGAAVQAGGEIVGYDDAVEIGRELKEANRIQADLEAEQADSIGEMLIEAAPSVGTVLAAGGLGLAVGGPIGGLVGLGLGSFGLNLGTTKEIQEQLGDTSEAGIGTLATAGAATAIDVLTGGAIGQGIKAPVKEAVKKTLTKRALEGAGIGAAGAGATQGTLDVGATLAADKELDADRVDAISENIAMTAAFGAGLGGLGGGLVGGINKLRATQEAYDQKYIDARAGIIEPNPVATEDGFARKGIGRVFGKPFDRFRDGIRANSEFRKIRAGINQDAEYRTLNIKDEEGNVINTTSNTAQQYAGKYRPILGEVGKLSKREQKDIAKELATYTDIEQLSPNARRIKEEFLDDAVDFYNAQGFEVKKQRNFLPLSQDVKRIRDNRAEFEADMLANAESKMDADEFAQFKEDLSAYTEELITNGGEVQNRAVQLEADDVQIFEKALTNPDEALGELRKKLSNKDKLNVDTRNPLEMGRFLSSVDQNILEKWSNKNDTLFDRLNGYNNAIAERGAWAKTHGRNGEKLRESMLKGVAEELEAGRTVDAAMLQNFVDIANAQQRQYKRITDPKIRKAMENIRTYQYLRTLPSATLSSLVEPLLILERMGGKATITGLGKAVRQMARKKGKAFAKDTNVKGEELDRVANDFNISLNNSVSSTSQKFDADVQNLGGLERRLFKYNGLAYWTEFNRLMAGYAADNALLDATKQLAKGGLTTRKQASLTKKLREAGLNEEDALDALDPNTGKWDVTSPAYERVKASGINLIDDVVLRPDAGNRPLWQSDPHLMLVAQLKGWSTVFGNTVMTRWAENLYKSGAVENIGNAYKLATFMGIYTTALMTQTAIKDVVNDGEFELDERGFKDLSLLALGQMGPLGLITDSIAGGRGGPQRTAISLLAGPTGTQAVDTVSGVTGVINGTIDPTAAVREIMISVGIPNIPSSGYIKDVIREAYN